MFRSAVLTLQIDSLNQRHPEYLESIHVVMVAAKIVIVKVHDGIGEVSNGHHRSLITFAHVDEARAMTHLAASVEYGVRVVIAHLQAVRTADLKQCVKPFCRTEEYEHVNTNLIPGTFETALL